MTELSADEETNVFRALSDVTRRQILQELAAVDVEVAICREWTASPLFASPMKPRSSSAAAPVPC